MPKRRILLKLSGEALMGSAGYGIDSTFLAQVAEQVREIRDAGFEIAIVVGGGNIFRGLAGASTGMDRSSADQMGMLATVINSIAIRDALERVGLAAVVQSALTMPTVVESFVQREAVRHLRAGTVVIFAAGTGNPFFTTDTAAALRAAEIGASFLVKGTKVDGVYDDDPKKNPQAKRYVKLSYNKALADNLKVMDLTAITLCQENRIPILVCSLVIPGAIKAALMGDEDAGTLIQEDS